MANPTKTTRLKIRRIIRRQKKLAGEVTEQADQQVEKLFIKRFANLHHVRRFVAVWICLVLFLTLGALWQVRAMDKYYLSTVPVSGGVYREGIIGTFTNANPLFAVSTVDASVSRLIFSGLFKISLDGEILGDLARDYTVDEKGEVYTVSLLPDVKWQDGEVLNADDVVFTYRTIQNAETRSPLRNSWQGVRVEKVDDYTVTFTLPSALSSFPYELVNGIVPEHLLATIDAAELRSATFNTLEPIGSGPFELSRLDVSGQDIADRQEIIALTRYEDYHGAKPGLSGVVVRTYRNEESMRSDFEEQIIQAMVGLTSVDESLSSREGVKVLTNPLTSSVMVFFNNSNPILSDVKVRQALTSATNTAAARDILGFRAIPSDSPFLKSQFTYDPAKVQRGYDVNAARELLDEAGWQFNPVTGFREKDGKPLSVRLVSQSLSEYAAVVRQVQEDWIEVGVKVDAVLQPEEEIQSGAISRHDYDVLLYGIAIGFDPDVYAYWHSSQANPASATRLNLSEYQNSTADVSLEAGRTRQDPELRKIKYQPFLDAWIAEAPAVALYQPRFVLVVQGTFEGYQPGQFRTAVDRYSSISMWRVRNAEVVK